MGLKRRLLRNITANWLGFAVQVVITLLLTPFVLQSLGEARYGVWVLIIGLTGYYGLLDLGLRASLTQRLSRQLAVGDVAGLNQTASIGLTLLSGTGLLLAAASFALAWWAPVLLGVPPQLTPEVRGTIALVGVAVAVQFPLFPFSAALAAAQRHDVLAAISIAVRVGGAGATVAVLKAGYGLVGLSAVTAAMNFLDYFFRSVAAARIVPQMKARLSVAALVHCRGLVSFGVWNSILAGSQELISYTNALLIGAIISTAAVSRFALASSLVLYFGKFFAPVAWALFPAVAHMDARGERERLRAIYLTGTRVMLCLATGACLIAAFWSDEFYRLWLDGEFANGPPIALLFQILSIAAVVSIGQQTGRQILLGAGKVRPLALIALGEGITAVLLSALLIKPFELLGVAAGVLAAALVFQGILQSVVIVRHLELPPGLVLRSVCPRPLALSVALVPALIAIRAVSPPVRSAAGLAAIGLAASAAAAVLLLVFGLRRDERREWTAPLLGRIAAMIGRERLRKPSSEPAEPVATAESARAH